MREDPRVLRVFLDELKDKLLLGNVAIRKEKDVARQLHVPLKQKERSQGLPQVSGTCNAKS